MPQDRTIAEPAGANSELPERVVVAPRDRDAAAEPSPLPRMQLALLASMNFINSVCFLTTFPLVPFMVLSFFPGLSAHEVGYYSGSLEGSFHAGAVIGAFFWGWTADRIGRRPSLLWGLAGTVVSAIAFGSSRTYGTALAAKFVWGLLNGNVGVTKTALSEVCDDTNSAKAFSFIGVATGMGRLVGPALGGLLSQPAIKYPAYFAVDSLFGRFPFLLPCLATSSMAAAAFVLSLLFLKETQDLDKRGPAVTAAAAAASARSVELAPLPPQPEKFCGTVLDEELEVVVTESDVASMAAELDAIEAGHSSALEAEEANEDTFCLGEQASIASPSKESAGATAARSVLSLIAERLVRVAPSVTSAVAQPVGSPASKKRPSEADQRLGSVNAVVSTITVQPNGGEASVYDGFTDDDLGDREELCDEQHGGAGDGGVGVGWWWKRRREEQQRRERQERVRLTSTAVAAGSGSGSAAALAAPALRRRLLRDRWKRLVGLCGDGSSSSSSSSSAWMARIQAVLLCGGRVRRAARPPLAAVAPAQRRRCCCSCLYATRVAALLGDRGVGAATAVYASLSFIGLFATELFPIYTLNDAAHGGFGWGSTQVGFMAMCGGPLVMAFQLLVYNRVVARCGLLRTARGALALHAAALAATPLCSLAARGGAAPAAQWAALFAAFAATNVTRIAAFTCTFVFVANAAAPADRSTVNGIAQALASAVRAAGPSLGTALFAWSLSPANVAAGWPWDYHLTWYVVSAAALGVLALSYALPPWIERKRPAAAASSWE